MPPSRRFSHKVQHRSPGPLDPEGPPNTPNRTVGSVHPIIILRQIMTKRIHTRRPSAPMKRVVLLTHFFGARGKHITYVRFPSFLLPLENSGFDSESSGIKSFGISSAKEFNSLGIHLTETTILFPIQNQGISRAKSSRGNCGLSRLIIPKRF